MVIAGIKSDDIVSGECVTVAVVSTGCQGDGREGAHGTGFQTSHVGPVPEVMHHHR